MVEIKFAFSPKTITVEALDSVPLRLGRSSGEAFFNDDFETRWSGTIRKLQLVLQIESHHEY
jgi:hypothetical protein